MSSQTVKSILKELGKIIAIAAVTQVALWCLSLFLPSLLVYPAFAECYAVYITNKDCIDLLANLAIKASVKLYNIWNKKAKINVVTMENPKGLENEIVFDPNHQQVMLDFDSAQKKQNKGDASKSSD